MKTGNDYLKDCFEKYERVRKSGKYNMITAANYAAMEAGLSINEYFSVQRNYSTLYKKYGNKA